MASLTLGNVEPPQRALTESNFSLAAAEKLSETEMRETSFFQKSAAISQRPGLLTSGRNGFQETTRGVTRLVSKCLNVHFSDNRVQSFDPIHSLTQASWVLPVLPVEYVSTRMAPPSPSSSSETLQPRVRGLLACALARLTIRLNHSRKDLLKCRFGGNSLLT